MVDLNPEELARPPPRGQRKKRWLVDRAAHCPLNVLGSEPNLPPTVESFLTTARARHPSPEITINNILQSMACMKEDYYNGR